MKVRNERSVLLISCHIVVSVWLGCIALFDWDYSAHDSKLADPVAGLICLEDILMPVTNHWVFNLSTKRYFELLQTIHALGLSHGGMQHCKFLIKLDCSASFVSFCLGCITLFDLGYSVHVMRANSGQRLNQGPFDQHLDKRFSHRTVGVEPTTYFFSYCQKTHEDLTMVDQNSKGDSTKDPHHQLESHANTMQDLHEKLVSNKLASIAFNNIKKMLLGKVKIIRKYFKITRNRSMFQRLLAYLTNKSNISLMMPATKNQLGAKSNLTTDVITWLMLLLEETPTITLKKLVENVKNEFKIHFLPGIQKTLENVKICLESSDQHCSEAILIDESGFNSNNHPSHGYSSSGKSEKLKTQKQEGAQSILLMEKQKRGCPQSKFSTFWFSFKITVLTIQKLSWKTPGLMVEMTLSGFEPTKKIDIKFLPKSLPFLNPIELEFNIIKTEIKLQSKIAEAIHQSISNNMTSELYKRSEKRAYHLVNRDVKKEKSDCFLANKNREVGGEEQTERVSRKERIRRGDELRREVEIDLGKGRLDFEHELNPRCLSSSSGRVRFGNLRMRDKEFSEHSRGTQCVNHFNTAQKFYSSCNHMQPITGKIIKDPENFFQVPSFNMTLFFFFLYLIIQFLFKYFPHFLHNYLFFCYSKLKNYPFICAKMLQFEYINYSMKGQVQVNNKTELFYNRTYYVNMRTVFSTCIVSRKIILLISEIRLFNQFPKCGVLGCWVDWLLGLEGIQYEINGTTCGLDLNNFNLHMACNMSYNARKKKLQMFASLCIKPWLNHFWRMVGVTTIIPSSTLRLFLCDSSNKFDHPYTKFPCHKFEEYERNHDDSQVVEGWLKRAPVETISLFYKRRKSSVPYAKNVNFQSSLWRVCVVKYLSLHRHVADLLLPPAPKAVICIQYLLDPDDSSRPYQLYSQKQYKYALTNGLLWIPTSPDSTTTPIFFHIPCLLDGVAISKIQDFMVIAGTNLSGQVASWCKAVNNWCFPKMFQNVLYEWGLRNCMGVGEPCLPEQPKQHSFIHKTLRQGESYCRCGVFMRQTKVNKGYRNEKTFVGGRESAGKGGFGFGGLSGHPRKIGRTRVVLEGAAGANWTVRAPGGVRRLRSGGLRTRRTQGRLNQGGVAGNGNWGCRNSMEAGAELWVGKRRRFCIYLLIYPKTNQEKRRKNQESSLGITKKQNIHSLLPGCSVQRAATREFFRSETKGYSTHIGEGLSLPMINRYFLILTPDSAAIKVLLKPLRRGHLWMVFPSHASFRIFLMRCG
ncbi:hypothetical protein VP01_289g3 [Puccinia sorghi]|uniref:Uncharacterized protein n=1 Tax=Puccinia sorghi TaxID=27349 RepID=A0A0L6V1H9_9BASI|nr:hypothetical protein VP01_289g3 [Puccinia sorghi]